MIDKDSILKQAKSNASAVDKRRAEDWERSFMFAVADLSTRLLEKDRLKKETVDVTSGTREVTLKGANCDISRIYYLLYGTGDDQVWVQYMDDNRFLKDYNSSDATADTPTYYTFIGMSGSYPRIRFNCPTASTTTMEVWYYADMETNEIRDSKGPALVNFTKSYFYGVDTERGQVPYYIAKGFVDKIRATSKPVADKETKFTKSRFDRKIESIRQGYRGRR